MKKARKRVLDLVLLAIMSTVTHEARADFSASGRRQKGKPTQIAGTPARAPAQKGKPKTTAAPRQEPAGTAALIARYTAIALSQPGVEFPIQRLAQLFRERDGKLDALIEDFERRAAAPSSDQWNARVALAGIYKHAGKQDLAITTLQAASTERPRDPTAYIALGQLYTDRGDKLLARIAYETALPLLKNATDSEQLLHTLLGLCLDLQDLDAAKRYHAELVKRAQGSFFARAELGRELLARGHYPEAEQQYRQLVQTLAGDNRVLAPALLDLARALAKQNRWDDALTELHRALQIVAENSGLRREIFALIVDIYRAEDRLAELIALLEKEHSPDFERQKLLAELYEETGQIEKALTAYRAALARQGRDIGAHLKVVQLLQAQGEIGKAIVEYEHLIDAAPNNADFVFRLADALLQQGSRQKALDYLRRLEAHAGDNPDTLSALVDFYERIAEPDKALHLLEKLSQAGDPERVIDLGNRYYDAGDKERAERTWKRVLVIGKNRAHAYQLLGDVYLAHDMADSALAALKTAEQLAPDQPEYRRAYALALERSGASQAGGVRSSQYQEAEQIWRALLQQAGTNEPIALEARQHIVTLWSLAGELGRHIKPLERGLQLSPPDVQAGRLLAEAQLRLKNYAEAERALRIVVSAAPGDASAFLGLERALVAQRKLEAAIDVLEKLSAIDPKRTREYTQRMAEYATELYQDDRALTLASRVVELNPDDADGHRRLAEMYRRRQEPDKAIGEFRKALAKNDRLFPVYFDLADLLLNRGDVEQADQLLRRVLGSASDEESIARAARLSMQINSGRGDLEPLEKELLPLALGNPGRSIYRRLLVEVYGAMTLPFVQQARSNAPTERQAAREQLERIGQRAVKPLLDAVSDEQSNQQRTAIELLTLLPNRSAAPALFAYAVGTADPESRCRAMIAAGSLDDPGLIPKLDRFLIPGGSANIDENDPVSMAALWALGHLRRPEAARSLQALTHADSETVRALAAFGLGFSGAHGSLGRLVEFASDPSESDLPRAAAALAIAELGDKSSGTKLAPLLELSEPESRAFALIALARLDTPGVVGKISEGLLSPDPRVANAARTAALVWSTHEYRLTNNPFALPVGHVEVRQMLEQLSTAAYSANEEAIALTRLEQPILDAVSADVHGSAERALDVIGVLLARDGKPAFGILTTQLDHADPDVRQRAEQTTEHIAASVVTASIDLLQHPSPSVRAVAASFLGTREEPLARQGTRQALSDPVPEVRQAALMRIARWNDEDGARAIIELLAHEATWPLRLRALEALGELSRLDSGSEARAQAIGVLAASARKDDTALVRQAALVALNKLDRGAAHTVLADVARYDDEAKLRDTAQALLKERP